MPNGSRGIEIQKIDGSNDEDLFGRLFGFLNVDNIQKYVLLAALIVVFLGMGLLNPHFLTLSNFTNIARQISIVVIIAVAMTFCIISGNFDLSVGSVGIMSGFLAGIIMVPTGSAFLGILAGSCAGIIFGFINGICITKLKVNAFVTTLGTMVIARGIALILTGGMVITYLPNNFNFIGIGSIMDIPVPIIIAAIVAFMGHCFLKYTVRGLHIYAVGGNYEATNLVGLKNHKIIIQIFTIQGFLASLGGLVLTARVVSAQPALMQTTNLDVIAAVVVGGISLGGGRGSIGGTLLGSILIGSLFNGLNVIGVGFEWQLAVIGGVIVLGVALDTFIHGNKTIGI